MGSFTMSVGVIDRKKCVQLNKAHSILCVRSFFLSYVYFYVNFSGKHLEYGLRDGKLLTYVKEFDGEDEILMRNYLKEASMHARGINYFITLC